MSGRDSGAGGSESVSPLLAGAVGGGGAGARTSPSASMMVPTSPPLGGRPRSDSVASHGSGGGGVGTPRVLMSTTVSISVDPSRYEAHARFTGTMRPCGHSEVQRGVLEMVSMPLADWALATLQVGRIRYLQYLPHPGDGSRVLPPPPPLRSGPRALIPEAATLSRTTGHVTASGGQRRSVLVAHGDGVLTDARTGLRLYAGHWEWGMRHGHGRAWIYDYAVDNAGPGGAPLVDDAASGSDASSVADAEVVLPPAAWRSWAGGAGAGVGGEEGVSTTPVAAVSSPPRTVLGVVDAIPERVPERISEQDEPLLERPVLHAQVQASEGVAGADGVRPPSVVTGEGGGGGGAGGAGGSPTRRRSHSGAMERTSGISSLVPQSALFSGASTPNPSASSTPFLSQAEPASGGVTGTAADGSSGAINPALINVSSLSSPWAGMALGNARSASLSSTLGSSLIRPTTPPPMPSSRRLQQQLQQQQQGMVSASGTLPPSTPANTPASVSERAFHNHPPSGAQGAASGGAVSGGAASHSHSHHAASHSWTPAWAAWRKVGEYEGQWVAGQRCGPGRMAFESGDVYDGEWRADVPHGRGRLHFAGGGMLAARWNEGAPHGIGIVQWPWGTFEARLYRRGRTVSEKPLSTTQGLAGIRAMLSPVADDPTVTTGGAVLWTDGSPGGVGGVGGGIFPTRTSSTPSPSSLAQHVPTPVHHGPTPVAPTALGASRSTHTQGQSSLGGHVLPSGAVLPSIHVPDATAAEGMLGAAADAAVRIAMDGHPSAHTHHHHHHHPSSHASAHHGSQDVATVMLGLHTPASGLGRHLPSSLFTDVTRLLRTTSVNDVGGGRGESGVLTAKTTDTVGECLKQLSDQGVLSMPVYDPEVRRFVGVVHLLDICSSMIDIFGRKRPSLEGAGHLREQLAHQRRFESQPVLDVLRRARDRSGTTTTTTVTTTTATATTAPTATAATAPADEVAEEGPSVAGGRVASSPTASAAVPAAVPGAVPAAQPAAVPTPPSAGALRSHSSHLSREASSPPPVSVVPRPMSPPAMDPSLGSSGLRRPSTPPPSQVPGGFVAPADTPPATAAPPSAPSPSSLSLSSSSAFRPLPSGCPLLFAAKVLAQGVHAVPIVDPEGNLARVVTQADVVRFLATHLDQLGPLGQMSVEELELGLRAGGGGGMLLARFQDPTIDVMRTMRDMGSTAAPVVDDYGALAANLSLSDLKTITRKAKLSALRLPILQFFRELDRAENVMSPSICFRLEDPLYKVVLTIAATRVHQLYFVDDRFRPVGCVRVLDILRLLVGHA